MIEFTVRRGTPSLVVPARPTPRERKPLSDVDDQEGTRIYSPVIHLFGGIPSLELDPAAVVRAALAEVLVHYYPLAGRLREEAGRKLVVDCAGQGVVFVEADADIAAHDLGDVRYPPFPRSEEFIYDDKVYRPPPIPGLLLPAIIDRPLAYVQVTRLKCGGFIVGHRDCHCIWDAPGQQQMCTAIGELARGAVTPSVPPVWAREIFSARQPPRPSFTHLEYHELPGDDRIATTPPHRMVRIPFTFGPKAMAALRRRSRSPAGSRFDLMAASLWRSRTVALGYAADDEVRLCVVVNARGRAFGRQLIPAGFYGNAMAYAVARCTAGELCSRDMAYAVELIREAKASITHEYMQSVADKMVLEGRPLFARKRTLMVSDLGYAGFGGVDLGRGKAVYSGPAKVGGGVFLGVNTYFLRRKEEEETLVPIYLPRDCEERFLMEMHALTTSKQEEDTNSGPQAKL